MRRSAIGLFGGYLKDMRKLRSFESRYTSTTGYRQPLVLNHRKTVVNRSRLLGLLIDAYRAFHCARSLSYHRKVHNRVKHCKVRILESNFIIDYNLHVQGSAKNGHGALLTLNFKPNFKVVYTTDCPIPRCTLCVNRTIGQFWKRLASVIAVKCGRVKQF